MYDKFIQNEDPAQDPMQETGFRDFSAEAGPTDPHSPHTSDFEETEEPTGFRNAAEEQKFRDTTLNQSSLAHLDDESAELLSINPSQYYRTDQQLLDKEKFIRNELLHDPNPHTKSSRVKKVVTRLEKDFRWGLGGQLMKRKKDPFNRHQFPTVERLVKYLEKELLKDISVVDMVALERAQLSDICIIATGYSNRHVYKAAKTLVKQLGGLEVEFSNPPMVFGRRDDEWVMVNVGKKILVHFMTENLRVEIDLENQWRNKDLVDLDDNYWEQYTKRQKEAENPFKFRNLSEKKQT
jgi:ribosomal silencing factor RsfS